MYTDEVGIENTLDYPYGYCHRSERFPGEVLEHQTERVSLMIDLLTFLEMRELFLPLSQLVTPLINILLEQSIQEQ